MELITVSETNATAFDKRCNELAKDGYKFVSSMVVLSDEDSLYFIQQWAKVTA